METQSQPNIPAKKSQFKLWMLLIGITVFLVLGVIGWGLIISKANNQNSVNYTSNILPTANQNTSEIPLTPIEQSTASISQKCGLNIITQNIRDLWTKSSDLVIADNLEDDPYARYVDFNDDLVKSYKWFFKWKRKANEPFISYINKDKNQIYFQNSNLDNIDGFINNKLNKRLFANGFSQNDLNTIKIIPSDSQKDGLSRMYLYGYEKGDYFYTIDIYKTEIIDGKKVKDGMTAVRMNVNCGVRIKEYDRLYDELLSLEILQKEIKKINDPYWEINEKWFGENITIIDSNISNINGGSRNTAYLLKKNNIWRIMNGRPKCSSLENEGIPIYEIRMSCEPDNENQIERNQELAHSKFPIPVTPLKDLPVITITAKDFNSWKKYTNSSMGYSIRYPSALFIDGNYDSLFGEIDRLPNAKEIDYCLIIADFKIEIANAETMSDYPAHCGIFSTGAAVLHGDEKIVSEYKLNIFGKEYPVFDIRSGGKIYGPIDRNRKDYNPVDVLKINLPNGKTIAVQFVLPEEEYNQKKDLIHQVISTLE